MRDGDVGRRGGVAPLRTRARVARAADLPGVPEVAEPDVVGGVEAGIGARGSAPGASGRPSRRQPAGCARSRGHQRGTLAAVTDPVSAGAASARIGDARVAGPCARFPCTTRGPGEVRPLEPGRPGRVGIYACGPTVYGRIHVGNARPFVVFSLLKRFLVARGLRGRLRGQHHRRQRQDLRRRSAGRASPARELAREMTAAYVADTDALGLGRPDHEPLASETIGAIVELIERLIERGMRTRRTATSTSRCVPTRTTANYPTATSTQMDQGEGGRGRRAQARPARLRALEGATSRARTRPGTSPWGPGRPGLAHRVLGDGRGAARGRLRDPRRRLRPDLPPPRERGGPDPGGARRAAGAAVGAQRDGPARQREDGQVGRQHLRAARGARRATAATR